MKVNEIINNTIIEYLNNDNSNSNLILYHGTKNKFNNFDLKFFNSATADGGWLGYGIYLTNDYEYAESYGDVLECKVNIKNPYILTDELYSTRPVKLKNELNANNAKEITTKLINDGYDSVLLKYPDDSWLNEFIELNVFNPNNITIINRYKQWDTSKEIKQKKGYINENSQQKIIAYHGSNTLFNEFDDTKIGSNSDVNSNGNLNNDKYGFFFTSDFDEAKSSGNVVAKQKGGKPIVYTCELTFSNPYTYSVLKTDVGDAEIQKIYNNTDGIGWGIFDSNRDFIIKRCLELNKDAILFSQNNIKFIVVFNKSQIKILKSNPFEIKYSYRDKY